MNKAELVESMASAAGISKAAAENRMRFIKVPFSLPVPWTMVVERYWRLTIFIGQRQVPSLNRSADPDFSLAILPMDYRGTGLDRVLYSWSTA